MLDSEEIPDNVRKTLRDTLSVFLQKFHRDYEKLKEDFELVKKQICDESSNNPTYSVKFVDTTLSGFHVQIKTLQDILGLDCIPKKKIAPSVKADSLRKFLYEINVALETESQINNISNIMKWPDNAVEFITKHKMQEAIIIFNPGRIDSIKKLYIGNDDPTASEYDVRIVEEIKMLEKNNMWISSLKANPDGDYPGFIAVVWGTLHTEMGEDHDADLVVGGVLSDAETDYENDEAKRAIETHEGVNKNSGGSSGNKRQKVNSRSEGTPPTSVVNSSNDSTAADGANVADRPNVVSRGRGTPPRGSNVTTRRMSPRTRRTAAV